MTKLKNIIFDKLRLKDKIWKQIKLQQKTKIKN